MLLSGHRWWLPPAARTPHATLAVAVAAVLGWEALLWHGPFAEGQSAGDAWWYLPPAVLTGGALLAVRTRRAHLRPSVLVSLAVALHLGFLATHLALGGPGDQDIAALYPQYGRSLLRTGALPEAEYPPLALLTFAAAAGLGDVRWTLPLLTLPLLAAGWWRLSATGPDGRWLAACIALCPTLVPLWEVKFDALPAALLLLGLLAASARAPGRAGVLLGLGAAAKWFPGLAVPVLAAGLLRRRDLPGLLRLLAGAGAAFAAAHLPFLDQPGALLAPYRFHAQRYLTGESLPYLPLRALGLVGRPERPWFDVPAPAWVAPATLLTIVLALAALVVGAALRPERAPVLASAAPAVFLLGNRIFSPQFLLPLAAVWAFGLSRRTESRVQATGATLLFVAATANYAVWPTASARWEPLQVLMFAAALTTTALTVAPAPSRPERGTPSAPSQPTAPASLVPRP